MATFRILYGIDCNLGKNNIELFDLELMRVNSLRYKQFLNQFQRPYHSMFADLKKISKENNSDKIFALISKSESPDKDYSYIFLNSLITACPSNAQFTFEIPFSTNEFKNYWNSQMTTIPIHYNYWDTNPGLFKYDCRIAIFDLYLKRFIDSVKNKDIEFTISTYINSFYCNRVDLCYLNLCMALESILVKAAEITYRLKRTIAVLCGDSVESCRTISSNVDNIYDLRSRIVHGGKYTSDDVVEYLQYLKLLTSITLIELIKHGFTKEEFNKRIVEIGYGEKKKISDNSYNLILNSVNHNIVQNMKLKKIK